MKQPQSTTSNRSRDITAAYFSFLDQHIEDVVSGRAEDFMEIGEIAQQLAVSHGHLSDTVQKQTGQHPCHFYDGKIIDKAKSLLLQTKKPIAEIALLLTYDPSNFSKFFKKWTNQTPGQFRRTHQKS